MLLSPRVYGLSIWLELSHPFNSLTRDKDLHTLPKITQCHHQHVNANISDFFRNTIVILSGQTLTKATSFKLQALTGVRADWQYSLKVLLCLHIQVMGVCSGLSVRPFSPNFISCLRNLRRFSYVNYHAIIPFNTQSINFDGFYL